MKVTIENVKANQTQFDECLKDFISNLKRIDEESKEVTLILNHVELNTAFIVLTRDKTKEEDVLDDLLENTNTLKESDILHNVPMEPFLIEVLEEVTD